MGISRSALHDDRFRVQPKVMRHPAVRALRPDLLPILAKSVHAILTIEAATSIEATEVLRQLRMDLVCEMENMPAILRPVQVLYGIETLRNARLSVLHTFELMVRERLDGTGHFHSAGRTTEDDAHPISPSRRRSGAACGGSPRDRSGPP